MSIFDEKDFSKIKSKKISDLTMSIKSFYNKKAFSCHSKSTGRLKYITWGNLGNHYVVHVLSGFNINSFLDELDDLEELEFVFNLIRYRTKYYETILTNEFKLCYKDRDLTFIKGILNLINEIILNEGLEFIEIEENKHKLISKDVNRLTKNLKNKDWRNQINIFFSLGCDEWVEREKILSWFAEHLTGDLRKRIENISIFNKQEISNLFKNLNNIYKHFGNDKKGDNLIDFNNFSKLSTKEKILKSEDDMMLVLYVLIEEQRIKKKQ